MESGYLKVSGPFLDEENFPTFTMKSVAIPWGGYALYKPCRYVPPLRVWFLHCFGLKMCREFAHFGPESAMVFEGTTGVY